MPSPYDQQIEDLLDQYRRQRDEAAETRRRINETTSTVTAARQTVRITVGAQGDVTAIEFPTGAYRRMAPKELADVLLTTLRQARSEALEGVAAVLADRLPSGVTVPDLLRGQVDPGAVLPEDPVMPDSVRDYVDHGFQGDTHE
ncbi:YbaB/EbfC family nucleoid-associated protein [Streptomyces sp. LP11]|uniref:YbaB/EbfC family nucleoid-associated protein n=1 Tax=Streptomyces pyxinicus TaxID=2970331 RepID=A0ABT2BCQ3_9ACTN|nr:YbaB/EbfC family nucleoid-associated protein [Streptomyces sp. LP11]MCS0606299.1 YbaB/EbfC family nucleoid-associated protein [Streptomyces sp. LP11]